MHLARIAFLITALLATPAFADGKTFHSETFTLKNGMQVVVIPNHRAPVVTHMVWYKVGAIDEQEGESGAAHFLEHLMFKGTQTIPPGEFSKRVRTMGGDDNAFTSQDYTAYFQSVSLSHLEDVMKMEADRMNGLTFPEKEVDSERKVVLEERRQRTENDPQNKLYEQMQAALFINHPYGDPVLGWQHELDGLQRDHVMGFYRQWYAPNNAILIVTGDITAQKLRPMADAIYGVIPAHQVPKRHWTTVPPLPAATRLTLRDPTVRQAAVTRLYRAPSYTQNKQESLALQVLESVLDGGSAARLYKTLVVEKKVATSVSLSYDSAALSDGMIALGLSPADGVTPEQAEQAVDNILRTLISGGVTEDELRAAKDRMKDEAVLARDSLSGPAMIFGQELTTGNTIGGIEGWPDMIDTVTVAQLQDAAKRFLNPDAPEMNPPVTGYLLPEEAKR